MGCGPRSPSLPRPAPCEGEGERGDGRARVRTLRALSPSPFSPPFFHPRPHNRAAAAEWDGEDRGALGNECSPALPLSVRALSGHTARHAWTAAANNPTALPSTFSTSSTSSLLLSPPSPRQESLKHASLPRSPFSPPSTRGVLPGAVDLRGGCPPPANPAAQRAAERDALRSLSHSSSSSSSSSAADAPPSSARDAAWAVLSLGCLPVRCEDGEMERGNPRHALLQPSSFSPLSSSLSHHQLLKGVPAPFAGVKSLSN